MSGNYGSPRPIEGRLRLPSGTDAYTCTWRAEQGHGQRAKGRPPVLLLHGFGEHCRRYDELAGSLAGDGFTVRSIDLPGHGRSQGRPGDAGDLGEALGDVDAFFSASLQAEGASEAFVYGHSMGGALAAAATTGAFPGIAVPALRGLVLSAPAVHVATRPAFQVGLARLVGAVWPLAPVARVAPSTISSQLHEQAAYGADPLVPPRTPVRAALLMHDAGRLALAAGEKIRVPVLLLHGEDDTLVPPAASRRLEAAMSNASSALVSFAGCRHEVHHDHRRGELAAVVSSWLASQC
ncbi:MAG TPA: alpha/beta fold hydrolase [Acidimicrobiales bacterium]|nr:alpha/beta fold hydrolase [Acidimicrobiales bacterium]